MARIDAGALSTDVRWVHPSEIVEAARDQVEHSLRHHPLVIDGQSDHLVQLDPRLTASTLAHILENAAQYTPAGAPIDLRMTVSSDKLTVHVRDHGASISPSDLAHLFDRFYRGRDAATNLGTGMGLSVRVACWRLSAGEYGPRTVCRASSPLVPRGVKRGGHILMTRPANSSGRRRVRFNTLAPLLPRADMKWMWPVRDRRLAGDARQSPPHRAGPRVAGSRSIEVCRQFVRSRTSRS